MTDPGSRLNVGSPSFAKLDENLSLADGRRTKRVVASPPDVSEAFCSGRSTRDE